MAAAKMHVDQIETTTDLVRRLLATQFPHWSGLPIQPVRESGTDHALYRVGRDLVARLPIIDWAVDQAESDQRWLPVLAPHLTLRIPVPVAVGQPGEGYPWPWLVVPWIVGQTPNGENLDLALAAVALAQFVTALHGIPTADGPVKSGTTRGVPLANLDEGIRPWVSATRHQTWHQPGTSSTTEPGRASGTSPGMTTRRGRGGRAGYWPRPSRDCATTGTPALTSSPPLVTGSTLCWPTGPESQPALDVATSRRQALAC